MIASPISFAEAVRRGLIQKNPDGSLSYLGDVPMIGGEWQARPSGDERKGGDE